MTKFLATLLALTLALGVPAASAQVRIPVPAEPAAGGSGGGAPAGGAPAPGAPAAAPKPFPVEKALGADLGKGGFSVEPDGTLKHASGAKFDKDVVAQMGLEWKDGRLVFKTTKAPIQSEKLMPMLNGMLGFASVAKQDPGEVGKKLQELGVPVSYNNIHLVNPDGSATYFGLMLYHGLTEGGRKVDTAALRERLSGERLSQSLALFDSGYGQAFGKRRADIGFADVRAGLDLLGSPRAAGETPVVLNPGADIAGQIAGYQKALADAAKTASPAERARIEEAARNLETLSNYRYHSDNDLSSLSPDNRPVPAPGAPGAMPPALARLFGGEPTAPPSAGLPGLLSLIDTMPGPAMTTAQKEAFIKSFPMGETVWRMGAQDLWKKGLLGDGVKVAVIDTGVGLHPDLEGAVASRQNFTQQLDGNALGNHATHVAGTIHALAPKATINSYAALDPDTFAANGRMRMIGPEVDGAIIKAIDKAVADGNSVINMSLGGGGRPSDALASKITEYSKKGVIFVVSAGNGGPFAGEVSSPSSSPQAWTVGAQDSQGRVTSFTSFGRNFDPATMSYVVKPVLVAPGDDTMSSVAPITGTSSGWEYARMSGTSMAAPHVTGATALMVDAARRMNGLANPVEMSRRILDAFSATGAEVPHRELPGETPAEQRFIVVNPVAAYDRLRDGQAVARPPAADRPKAAPSAR